MNSSEKAFFELLRAGLWEQDIQLSKYGEIDFASIMMLAEEQSVVGLITAGLEHVTDVKIPQSVTLQFIGSTLQIELLNKQMNTYLAQLIGMLRAKDIYTLLVKGQGIAQCYERPLWRASGDIDLLFRHDNYSKAKQELLPLAQVVEPEFETQKHIGMTIDGFVVELHGTLHSRLSRRVDREIDRVQDECFYQGEVRSWVNENTQIFLPAINQDIIFVFTHILHHFFIEGVGLRQICDWVRLLWSYREVIDVNRLEKNFQEMGLVSEWKTFASLAVESLGMSERSMPLYSTSEKWSLKAAKVLKHVMETGNFGHNREITYSKYFLVRKISSLWLHTKDSFRLLYIFPLDTIKCWWQLLITGTIETVKGNG